MKNLKKVLAMVLAFACTFTMFASAKVYEDVQPGSEFSEAITMLSDLGIIQGKTDGKYHPEETITRAEACALIARLLTGDPKVANFGGAQNFTDVVKGSWQDSAIGYCVANGITVGVGNGKFEPNRAINDQEFLTMMVRALGYETPDVKQGYPFSYMTVANAIGLRQDTEMMANTDALRGEDAQIIYNAMFVDYAKGAKMINTTHGTSVEKYPTLAESVWGLDRAALGTFSGKDDDEVTLTNCKAHTWVIVGADKKEEGRILAYPIDDDTTDIYESDVKAANGTKFVPYSFKYEGDADALKGYQVELWGEGKHGTPTWEKGEGKFVYSDEWNIKAIKSVKGQTKYDYDASKADAKSDNGTIELGESKLELDSVADNAKKVVAKNTTETALTTYLSSTKYNGQSVAKDKDVESVLNIRDGAQYKLMDWDSDGDIDWVVVDEANYYKVESANSKRLTVSSMKSSTKDSDEEKQTGSETQTWKLDDLNDEKNYKVKFVAPEGVKEGDILEVTYKTAYDKKEKCEVVTATATVVDAENHELDKVSTKDHLVLTFDGETKQLAQNNDKADTIVPANPSKYEDFDEEELGTQFALHMNRNGFIVYSDYATETSNYMMVLDTDNGSDGARPELGAMKILTSDNKVEKNVEVVSDLRIDGKTSGNGYEKGTHSFVETKIVGNVYKYWKDADGRITKMESVIDATKTENRGKSYEYVAKNDRLTLDNNKSYALKDAKVIFAVKPHDQYNDYIQAKGGYNGRDVNLFVNEDDVLAVKQADIPDIGAKEDTNAKELDTHQTNTHSWVNQPDVKVVIDADKNKDINAAVLGVNNFNKFNAGSTKVGLVTNVSYDKSDVVSIDVATNGKVETLSSVEKTDFDDVVSVMEYTNKTTTKSYSVASRTEKINNGLMKDSTLKDYLNKNGAYAEITTDADGKLTGVLFMDTKKDKDGAAATTNTAAGVNADNVVVGDYYQVSRKVVADVTEGKWMSVIKGSAEYADADNFKTMDTKDEQKAADFTSDATYYLIDGKPTKHTGAYAGTKASVVDGFDGNPDVKAAEASDVRKSDIRNDNDSANDIYNVADVASKIDDNGAGDIVAVYMYDDDMGEKISIKGAAVTLTNATITVGQDAEVSVTLPKDENLDTSKVYVQVVDKDGKVVVSKTNVTDAAKKIVLDTKTLKEGAYTVQLFGYNKTDKKDDLIASTTLTIGAKQMYTVSKVEWVTDATGATTSTTPVIEAGTDGVFYVKVTSTPENAVLTKENLEVRVRGSVKDFELVSVGNGVYKITIAGNEKITAGDKITVTMKKGEALTEVPTTPIEGAASAGAQTSPDAAKAGDIKVKVGGKADELLVQVFEGDTKARAKGDPITTLKQDDFKVTVGNAPVSGLKVSEYKMDQKGYILTASSVSDWSAANTMTDITVTVGTYAETYDKVATADKITATAIGGTEEYEINSKADTEAIEVATLELENLTEKDLSLNVKVKDVAATAEEAKLVTVANGKVSIQAKLLNGLKKDETVKFEVVNGTTKSAELTVTAKETPAAAPSVDKNAFTFTKDSKITTDNVAKVTYAGKDELKIWKSGDDFATQAGANINNIVAGVNVAFDNAQKTITLTGTPTAKSTAVTFHVGTSAANKVDLTVTVNDAAPAPSVTLNKNTANETAFAELQTKEYTITVANGANEADLKVQFADSFTHGTAKDSDTKNGVTATLDKTKGAAKLKLTGKPTVGGDLKVFVGTAQANAGLTITVGKHTLAGETATASVATNKIVIDVKDAAIAKQLAAELKNQLTDLVLAGADGTQKKTPTGVAESGTTVEVTLTAGDLVKDQSATVKIPDLATFSAKEVKVTKVGA